MAETYLPVEREEWAGMPATALTDAAARAPAQPGVYFFAGADDTLLYVGKAANLRRRLADHARSRPRALGLRESARLGAVCTIRWEICADEEAALLREADLIVMLRPPFNASHTEQDPCRYLGVATDSSGLTSFDLLAAPGSPGRVYGCFPHLAKGAFSHAAKRTKAGYTALLRLLWAAQSKDPARIPGRIAGASPPTRHRAPVPPELGAVVHDFLSGRSARVVTALEATLATTELPDYMRPTLARDVVAARDFFELAPRRIRQFRLRYGLPRGPVPADVMAEILSEEVRAAIAEPSTR